MATKRRVRAGKNRHDLPGPGDGRPVSLECWRRHRKTLMSWSAKGHRPPEWWLYERNMECPEHQEAALFAMGELRKAELSQTMAWWREQYDRARQPGFAHCIGHAKPGDMFATWLEGLPALRAHFRWAGVPRKLIQRWNAEHRRSTKLVRQLECAER
jgi:hypothetical protein